MGWPRSWPSNTAQRNGPLPKSFSSTFQITQLSWGGACQPSTSCQPLSSCHCTTVQPSKGRYSPMLATGGDESPSPSASSPRSGRGGMAVASIADAARISNIRMSIAVCRLTLMCLSPAPPPLPQLWRLLVVQSFLCSFSSCRSAERQRIDRRRWSPPIILGGRSPSQSGQ